MNLLCICAFLANNYYLYFLSSKFPDIILGAKEQHDAFFLACDELRSSLRQIGVNVSD